MWFSLQLALKDFPQDWNLPAGSPRSSGGFARNTLSGRHVNVVLPLELDNAPTVGAARKLFTTKLPLAHFVMVLTGTLASMNAQIDITHVKGEDTGWADELSREQVPSLIRTGWNPGNRHYVSLDDMIAPYGATIYPLHAGSAVPDRLREVASLVKDPQGRASLQKHMRGDGDRHVTVPRLGCLTARRRLLRSIR